MAVSAQGSHTLPSDEPPPAAAEKTVPDDSKTPATPPTKKESKETVASPDPVKAAKDAEAIKEIEAMDRRPAETSQEVNAVVLPRLVTRGVVHAKPYGQQGRDSKSSVGQSP